MKLIEAIIKQIKLDEVKNALKALGIDNITENADLRRGHRKGESIVPHKARHMMTFVDRVKLQIIVSDDLVGTIIETIGSMARTRRREDCRIYIFTFAEAGTRM